MSYNLISRRTSSFSLRTLSFCMGLLVIGSHIIPTSASASALDSTAAHPLWEIAKSSPRIRQDQKVGDFFSTFYYVVNEATYPAVEEQDLLDLKGKILARVSTKFKKDLDMEGTGILRSGVTINYAARVEGKIRYRISRARWGYGVGTCKLRPYKSIAVDPKVIALGSVVFIPKAKGMRLPDGNFHDGIFYAQDIGNAIQQLHIDFFAQEGRTSATPFESHGLTSGSYVEAYVIRGPYPFGCHTRKLRSQL